jgi:hypothetical protein
MTPARPPHTHETEKRASCVNRFGMIGSCRSPHCILRAKASCGLHSPTRRRYGGTATLGFLPRKLNMLQLSLLAGCMVVFMLEARSLRVRVPDSALVADNVTTPYCVAIHVAIYLAL